MSFVTNSRLWQVFFHAPGARPMSVTFCILVAGLLDMLSIGAILPAIGSIGGQGVASNSKLNEYFISLVELFGLEPNVTTLVVLVAILLTLKSLMAMAAMSYVASSVANVQSELRDRLLIRLFSANWRYFVNCHQGILRIQYQAKLYTLVRPTIQLLWSSFRQFKHSHSYSLQPSFPAPW